MFNNKSLLKIYCKVTLNAVLIEKYLYVGFFMSNQNLFTLDVKIG